MDNAKTQGFSGETPVVELVRSLKDVCERIERATEALTKEQAEAIDTNLVRDVWSMNKSLGNDETHIARATLQLVRGGWVIDASATNSVEDLLHRVDELRDLEPQNPAIEQALTILLNANKTPLVGEGFIITIAPGGGPQIVKRMGSVGETIEDHLPWPYDRLSGTAYRCQDVLAQGSAALWVLEDAFCMQQEPNDFATGVCARPITETVVITANTFPPSCLPEPAAHAIVEELLERVATRAAEASDHEAA